MGRSLAARLVDVYFILSGHRRGYTRIARQVEAGTFQYQEETYDVRRCLKDVRSERSCGRTVHLINDKSPEQTTLFYLHGGGYAHPASKYHYRFLRRLVRATDWRVIFPIYGRAPLHTCNEEIPLLAQLYRRYTAGCPRIIVGGDSAGGGLAVALTCALKEEEQPLPQGLMLFSPWVDLTVSNPEIARLRRQDRMIDLYSTEPLAELWSDHCRDAPLASPLFADLSGLPPCLLYTGTRESLYPDTLRFRQRLEQSRVRLIYREYDGMGHVFILYPIKEAAAACRDLLHDLDALLADS